MWYYWGWELAALLIAIFIEIALICCRKFARKTPLNYILLLIFTVCETYAVACSVIWYSSVPATVIQAGIGTAMITLACTAYAFKAKTDFTMKGGIIFIAAATMMFLIMFSWIFALEGNYIAYDIIIAICILLLGLFLIHDT